MKTTTSTTPSANWNVNGLLNNLHERHESWRFHQLFRLLRLTESRTRKTGWARDLGHFEDSVLGNRHIQVQERTHQLVHRLRHGNVESRQRRDSNDNLVHGVPQNLLLRPGQGRHPVRPQPAGLFIVEAEELRLGCGGVPDRRRIVHLAPPHPGPGCPLSPWGGMVRRFSQGHGDGHPLMPQHGAEPSLSPPTCGSRSDINTTVRHHEVFTCC